jgi:hypothetical protein
MNGSAEPSLYRVLHVLAVIACGGAVAALAGERGLASVLWARPFLRSGHEAVPP